MGEDRRVTAGEGVDPYPHNPTLRAISRSRRREILDTLEDGDSPMTERDLAATGADPSPAGGTSPRGWKEQINVVHSHLPALAAAGLVVWNRDDGTVETGTHPALDDPRFRRLLSFEAEDLDAVLSGLSHDHRRIVPAALEEAGAPLTLSDLAGEIRRHENEVTGRVPPAVDDVLASLHHAHLPKLDEAGIVEYDSAASRAAYAEHETLEDVLGIIYEPNETIGDRLDGFLEGLHDSYRQARPDASGPFAWPHYWRTPHRV